MKKYDLYLTGTVGGWGISADYVKYVLDKKKGQPVDVAICSLGGYVDTGLQIYELFKNHGQVTCHFIGMSASAATFMAMGAKTVKMSKNALILIHNGMSEVWAGGMFNKEQIDELVKKLQFKRSQLNTIDDVIAQIYADRNGRNLDDVKQKMKVAAWIKASEAKDFGLVDEIFEAEKVQDQVQNRITNSLIKDMGLPALPRGFNPETGEENPTAGVLQKVVEMLKGLMAVTTTDNCQNKMIKVFTTLMALLAIKDGFKPDEQGNVALTQDQLKAIDDELKLQNEACKKASEKLKEQQTKIAQLEKDLKARDDQIKNLKGASGGTSEEVVDNADYVSAAAELFNSVKEA